MSGVLHGVIASLKTAVASVTDAYWKYVSLLLNTTSTNGAQNNTFLDSSANAFSVTRNGDTTQGSFNPYMPTGYWSGYFDVSGDSLTVPYGSTLALGTGDCTIEAWVYLASYPQQFNNIVDVRASSSTYSNDGISFSVENDGTVSFWAGSYSSSTYVLETAAGKVSLNTWSHLALTRASGTTKLYVNGVEEASSSNAWNQTSGTATTLYIGNAVIARQINGYISSLRIVKGTAVYTSNFTPSTAPLTAITNTSLLCLQDNRFIDNSTNAFAITVNGDTRISKRAPFNPPASYSTATYGGSGYFDGTGDYLSVPASSQFLPGANTDFTFEAWVYLTATPSAQSAQIVGTGEYGTSADWNIVVNSSRQPSFYFAIPPGGFSITSSVALDLYTWNHIAVTRSGTGTNNLKMFLNGVNVAQASRNDTMDYTGNNLTIGADQNGDEAVFTGYISGLRLLNGTGYTSISVPTAPPTNITNTVLLLNFDNAGIYDAATINDAQTVGNAQASTTQAKFGTTSMYFDGTGDNLSIASSTALNLSRGDFTIEAWVYWSGSNTNSTIINKDGLIASSYPSYDVSLNGSGYIICYVGSGNGTTSIQSITSNTLLPTNTWVHLAFVKNGTTLTLYQNGVSVASATQTATITDGGKALLVGYNAGQATKYYFNGYIQDLRITNGYARYTGNFTPPTAAFPTL